MYKSTHKVSITCRRKRACHSFAGRCDNGRESLRHLFCARGEREGIHALGEDPVWVVALREVRLDNLAHLFLRVADHDMRVVDAGDGTFDEDEVERGVDADDF